MILAGSACRFAALSLSQQAVLLESIEKRGIRVMSRSCLVIETSPDNWHYLIEDEGSPPDMWDWREKSTAYGPFTTRDDALDHRADNHANVAGSEIQPYVHGAEIDIIVAARIAESTAPAHFTY